MKLESVAKLGKKNKIMSKTFSNNVISKNYDVIAICLIYSQYGATQKPDSRRIVCKNYIFMKSNVLSYKI